MSNEPLPQSEFILYQTEDGQTRLEVRLQDETVWLTQKLMAELFQTSVPNVSMHIRNLFAEGELQAGSVVKEFLTTAADGKGYATQHYNLDVKVSHEAALARAETEFEKFRRIEDAKPSPVEQHFIEAIEQVKQLENGKRTKKKKP